MATLEECRASIDRIDDELTRLFEERMGVVREVAKYKRAHGLPIFQPDRERLVLGKAVARLEHPEYAPGVRALYETLMAVSRLLQHEALEEEEPAASNPWVERPVVAFPGAQGAFSEQATLDFFGDAVQAKPYSSFSQAAEALSSGEVDYAVLPIENSTAGSVDESYRLLIAHNLSIVGEQLVPVRHHLLGAPGAELASVREVRSHPQAIAQCHAFLAEHPAWRIVPSLNTALSARAVAELKDPAVAAIASMRAARRYGLQVLEENIHEARGNCTRFIVAARAPAEQERADKASVLFTLENQVGALARMVGAFARQGINLSRLESRPMPDTPWAYTFYADLEWHTGRRTLELALEEARLGARTFRLLGLYKKGGEACECGSR